MIQTLVYMIRIFFSYGLEPKYSNFFTHDWCTLIPAMEMEYENSIHSSTGKKPAMLGESWNPRLPYYTLKHSFIDIHPIESMFKTTLDKARHHANISMQDFFNYAK
ncbi:hypothetical protein O181_061398 [Austropuccinia psidii MF-1]|uniref:Integrase catalytic domain-containing protein n=1 Tax=Austropuccinia psidii MF-1 TaxID=1389203 RepID=A0A9Q3EMR1_9BASI|nr:hypothetical protein [Austropuccinia psidii MF-1]